jgi:hypothetical protein
VRQAHLLNVHCYVWHQPQHLSLSALRRHPAAAGDAAVQPVRPDFRRTAEILTRLNSHIADRAAVGDGIAKVWFVELMIDARQSKQLPCMPKTYRFFFIASFLNCDLTMKH